MHRRVHQRALKPRRRDIRANLRKTQPQVQECASYQDNYRKENANDEILHDPST
jgi:uncharacterized protein YdhG (YjbR/CyaY superfamily)